MNKACTRAASRKPASSSAVTIRTFVLVKQVDCAPVRYAPAAVAGCSRHVPSPAKKIFEQVKEGKKIKTNGLRQEAVLPSIHQHASTYFSIRQHTSAYVSIRQNLTTNGLSQKVVLGAPHSPDLNKRVCSPRTYTQNTSIEPE